MVDSVAPSYVAQSAQVVGSAATAAEERKSVKYAGQLPIEYEFVPLGFETLGSMGASAKAFLADLGKRLIEASGDKRASSFLLQRLSLAIVRGNAASILGSLATEEESDGPQLMSVLRV